MFHRMSAPGVCVAQDLHGVFYGDAFSGEVGAELGHAADVSGGDELCAGVEDGLGFGDAEAGGDFGLVDVVGSGAAAAEVGVGEFGEFEGWDGGEEGAGFVADALGVGEVAGVLVGDAAILAGGTGAPSASCGSGIAVARFRAISTKISKLRMLGSALRILVAVRGGA